jgi:DNA-binding protein H-NS
MATLSALKKQIAALEAQVERVTKAEMGAAILKVKKLMSDFGLTVEHLTGGSTQGRPAAAKKIAGKKAAGKKAAAKTKGSKPAKYQDSKSGATWSGLGRVPHWIAKAKNRDDFLIGQGAASAVAEPEVKVVASKKAGKKVTKKTSVATKSAAPAKKVVRAAAKKATATKVSAKKATTKKAPAKKAAAKKSAPTKAAKKAASAPTQAVDTQATAA